MALLAAIMVMAVGTVGLMALEDMTPLEALYMVIITLSTVGFGEVKELHDTSRVFVMFLIVFGVLLGGFVVTVIGQFVLEGQFREIVTRRKMDKQIRKLKEHYIVAGYGRVGRQVVHEFQKRKVPFVVVEKDKESIRHLLSDGYPFVEGDATDDEVLRRVNIKEAHTLVSTLPEEAHNVYLTLTARYLNGKLIIIARADFEEGEKKLIRAGANHVVIPHVIGGLRMAMASLQPNVVDFMQIAAVGDEGLSLEELVVPMDSKLIGDSLRESGLKVDYGVTIIGIKHRDEKMTLNPGPSELLREGDILVLIGQNEQLVQLNRDLSL
jgi:voltage-gated potassium channel